MRKIEDKGLLGMAPLPCFFFDREYTEAATGIFREEPNAALARWVKIGEAIARFPNQTRRTVWLLLRMCDSHTREGTACCDLYTQTFLSTIIQEQHRLHTLRKTANQPTLFRSSLNDPLLRYCDTVQLQLDRARAIVEEACTRLEPAKKFFLNQRSPSRREAKRALLEMLKTLPSTDGKKAAALASTLLNLADPKRPATREAIRQLGFARYRPE